MNGGPDGGQLLSPAQTSREELAAGDRIRELFLVSWTWRKGQAVPTGKQEPGRWAGWAPSAVVTVPAQELQIEPSLGHPVQSQGDDGPVKVTQRWCRG